MNNYLYLILLLPFSFLIVVQLAVTKFASEQNALIWNTIPKGKWIELVVAFSCIFILLTIENIYLKWGLLIILIISAIPLTLRQYIHVRSHKGVLPLWLVSQSVSGGILLIALILVCFVGK